MTQGKCVRCMIHYKWNDRQRLCDSYCIYCDDKLNMTSRLLGSGKNGQAYKEFIGNPKQVVSYFMTRGRK